jgi:hypothetical protein
MLHTGCIFCLSPFATLGMSVCLYVCIIGVVSVYMQYKVCICSIIVSIIVIHVTYRLHLLPLPLRHTRYVCMSVCLYYRRRMCYSVYMQYKVCICSIIVYNCVYYCDTCYIPAASSASPPSPH